MVTLTAITPRVIAMSHSPRQKHTPEQWQQLIDAQAASGQSQVAFCAERGLSKSSFQHWKRRLRTSQAPVSTPSALFAPLADEPGNTDSGWTIELDLGDGVCLRLRRP
ncbi:IS66 family insertion sequence element accessory protein TnpB [Endozoicomonas sp. G2_2]|uniref:IS66 family insertion sequence element accessory protein TnpA n=1 Tax=Endozoicomonas sp. G2_2 TaxID=2821092 RepID=UPI001ADA3205|nr:IS66 family insertion sequence element accessory protein TnpB [Endozoicomonas sp. G2_2]MBO9471629.1 IS66 family insertion sequence element accessory protein TnpB [Endozoicomonas sp. G2_2]MBO9471646.1 IS66 family insertion sequence element accessory protein TnpB [Endozoicomonas sp. G2_2]